MESNMVVRFGSRVLAVRPSADTLRFRGGARASLLLISGLLLVLSGCHRHRKGSTVPEQEAPQQTEQAPAQEAAEEAAPETPPAVAEDDAEVPLNESVV